MPYLVMAEVLMSAATAAALVLAVSHSELTYLPYFLCYKHGTFTSVLLRSSTIHL